MRLCLSLVVAAVLGCLLVGVAEASLSHTAGSSYAQDFNTLTTSSSSTTWTNDTTLPGWSLFISTNAAAPTYAANAGTGTTGSFWSYGTGTQADRALGGQGSGGSYFGTPASGAVAGYIAVAFTNTGASAIDNFTVSYNGEQWRNGGNAAAQTMVLEYGFGSTFSTVSSWTAPGGNFDWSSPVVGSTAAALDGNVAGLVPGKGGTISNLTWPAGGTLWLRWIENNDVGNDHGLAIDDFSFSTVAAAVVPEPASLLVWGGIGLLGVGLAIYKKKVA